jgi:hypothetical protein
MVGLVVLALLALLLTACEGYSQTGARSSHQQGINGGTVTAGARKANGSSTQDIELDEGGFSGPVLEADVTLTVGKGSFKIELLGEEEQVTLTLEARDGQTASGHGQMAVDSFGEASYRVTATEAEDVEYRIDYTFP